MKRNFACASQRQRRTAQQFKAQGTQCQPSGPRRLPP
jgi:hypothetical protein